MSDEIVGARVRISPEMAAEFIDFGRHLPDRYTVSGFRWCTHRQHFVANVTGDDAATIPGNATPVWRHQDDKLVFVGWE